MTQADGFVRKGETILGRVIDGEFQPLAPAPTGVERDDLILECLDAMKLMNRKPMNSRELSESRELIEEAIDRGTLRTANEMRGALNTQSAHFKRETLLGRRGCDSTPAFVNARNWADRADLKSRLGIPPLLPLKPKVKTEAELVAEAVASARLQKQRAQQKRIDALVDTLAGPETTRVEAERETAAMQKRFGHAHTVEKYLYIEQENRRGLCRELEPPLRTLVATTTYSDAQILKWWKDAQDERDDALKYVDEKDLRKIHSPEVFAANFILRRFAEVTVLTPSEIPPLKSGESRLVFASKAEFLKDLRDIPKWEAIYKRNETVLRMAHDGTLVFDVIPLEKEANV